MREVLGLVFSFCLLSGIQAIKCGKVKALLTSDSPALIGSNITFAVTLQFQRCWNENQDGGIVYDTKCINDSSVYPDQYRYNWTNCIDHCDKGNCSFSNEFPHDRPFHHHDWRRRNFIFPTLGQYYNPTGRSSAVLSLNTTNITVGSQIMEVSVYRRGRRHPYPVAKGIVLYDVTDRIPFYVNISQKNNRNSSDDIFIKDSPIQFAVQLHDPSNYLSRATLSFHWTFGDGSGLFVSNNLVSSHIYTLLGNFTLNLTVKAAFPAPCQPTTPTPTTQYPTMAPVTSNTTVTENSTDSPLMETASEPEGPIATTEITTHVHKTAPPGCFVNRYGNYTTNLRIVDGILAVNILDMNRVSASSEAQNTLVDFMVSCVGSLPTDACTRILDSTCRVPQNEVCDKMENSDRCLFILRRAFAQPGTYCVNITLSDDRSQAFASTLVSVMEGQSSPAKDVLICLGLLVFIVVLIGALMYIKSKGYKHIANTSENGTSAFTVQFKIKSGIFKGSDENHPLLNSGAII